jgi:predicted nucleic acid-binding protein
MLLVDSSVWIEILRGRSSDWSRVLLGSTPDLLAVTEPVVGEVLAGARDPEKVEARLAALPLRRMEPGLDYRTAATLFRASRRAGLTVRNLTDCLIAAVALRHGDTVVHRDADFEALARVSSLATLDLR